MAADKLTIDKPWKFPSRIETRGLHFAKGNQVVNPRLPRVAKVPDGVIDSLPRLVRRPGGYRRLTTEVA